MYPYKTYKITTLTCGVSYISSTGKPELVPHHCTPLVPTKATYHTATKAVIIRNANTMDGNVVNVDLVFITRALRQATPLKASTP